ncbi:hypothetical protein [Actinokineospora sp.]|uniref:hypothetical protein n=1 Tax=Actinokineospora sp. TaxID=1872133 RepID=UPI004037F0DC
MTARGTTEAETSNLTWPVPTAGLNQPWRLALAVGEVLAAVLLGWLAVWLWSEGTVLVAAVDGRPELVFERYLGNWIAGAIGVATLAVLLLFDAPRQAVLGVRTRSRAR